MFTSKVKQLQNDLMDARAQLIDQQLLINDLQKKLENCKYEKDESQKKYEDLRQEVDGYINDKNCLQKKYEELVLENTEIQRYAVTEINQYEDRITEYEETVDDLQEKNKELSELYNLLRESYLSLKAQELKCESEYNYHANQMTALSQLIREKNVRYSVLIDKLAEVIWGEMNTKKWRNEAVELTELMIEEEFQKKMAYANLCAVLHKVAIRESEQEKIEQSLKWNIEAYFTTLKKDLWYNLLDRNDMYNLSRWRIIKSYVSWYKEAYNNTANIKVLNFLLCRNGWKNEDTEFLLELYTEMPQVAIHRKQIQWKDLESFSPELLDLTIDDIIKIYFEEFKDQSGEETNIDKLFQRMEKVGCDASKVSRSTVESKIYALKVEQSSRRMLVVNPSETNNGLQRQIHSNYTPHYGTEYVSGHFRVRNGRTEWVSGHFRRR